MQPITISIHEAAKATKSAVINEIAISLFFFTSDIATYEHANPVRTNVTPRANIIKVFIKVTKGNIKNKTGIPIR